jgi:hypothetical protein
MRADLVLALVLSAAVHVAYTIWLSKTEILRGSLNFCPSVPGGLIVLPLRLRVLWIAVRNVRYQAVRINGVARCSMELYNSMHGFDLEHCGTTFRFANLHSSRLKGPATLRMSSGRDSPISEELLRRHGQHSFCAISSLVGAQPISTASVCDSRRRPCLSCRVSARCWTPPLAALSLAAGEPAASGPSARECLEYILRQHQPQDQGCAADFLLRHEGQQERVFAKLERLHPGCNASAGRQLTCPSVPLPLSSSRSGTGSWRGSCSSSRSGTGSWRGSSSSSRSGSGS